METVKINPFAGRSDSDVLRIKRNDGEVFTGSYMYMGGMHFLTMRIDGQPLDHVEGPFLPEEVTSIEVLRTREEIMAERHERKLGERIPGTYRKTRSGYEARLYQIARIHAQTDNYTRKRQIRAQFDEVADEIELAQTKREWILIDASHRLRSNEPLRKRDIGCGDNFSLGKIQRVRDQDFDPDPKVRRARPPVPDHVAKDPLSAPNLMKALRRSGFRAVVSMTGEILDDIADVFVEFPGGKKFGRFSLTGTRQPHGGMAWDFSWHGNRTKADLDRMYRCLHSASYNLFKQIVATGLTAVADQEGDR